MTTRKYSVLSLGAAVLVGVWCALAMLPVLVSALSSLKDNLDIIVNPLSFPLTPKWSNYAHALSGPSGGAAMQVYLINSVVSSLVGLLVGVTFSVLAGYALWRRGTRHIRLTITYFVGLMTIPPAGIFVSLFLMTGSLGLRDSTLWLGVVYAAQAIPLGAILMYTFFRQFPDEIIQAARVDGANEFQLLRSVVLPLMRGPIGTVALISLIGMWNDLIIALVMLNDSKTFTIPAGIALFNGQRSVDFGSQFAALMLAIIPIILAYAVFNRQFIEGLRAGAIRG